MVEIQSVFNQIEQLTDRYYDIWEALCNLDSPTANKESVDKAGNYCIALAQKQGWEVEVMEHPSAGNAICITANPEAKAAPVVFSGHIDTVHPIGLFGTPAAHRDEARLYGPGAMDCKGGVVGCFLAMEALSKAGFRARPIKLVIQTDEETGSKNSNKATIAFMIEKSKDAVAFLNTEGHKPHTAVIARKGILRYRLTVTGKAVHSALCYEGANAITEAAHKIIALEALKDRAGLTCNCGTIEGGTVANTVAEQCSFTVDFRFADQAQYEAAIALIQKVAAESVIEGCSCQVEKISDRPAMPKTEKNLQLLDQVNAIYSKCGLPQLAPRFNHGGSDAAYTTCADIPTLDCLGVTGWNIHSVREYADLSSLAECAKRLASVAFYIE